MPEQNVVPPSQIATELALPPVVPAEEWERARQELEAEELALDEARVALAAKRRRMPMTRVPNSYRFLDSAGDEVGLLDLFAGRRQLITYKFFYAPDVGGWPEGGCEGCSMFADSLTHPAHLAGRDVSLALVSFASPEHIKGYRKRMGWEHLPWFSEIGDQFTRDFGVTEWFGFNVFLRDGDEIYRTYFLQGPMLEAIGSSWTLLELTPYGRQESRENSPSGWPQDEAYAWYRRHDEYDAH